MRFNSENLISRRVSENILGNTTVGLSDELSFIAHLYKFYIFTSLYVSAMPTLGYGEPISIIF